MDRAPLDRDRVGRQLLGIQDLLVGHDGGQPDDVLRARCGGPTAQQPTERFPVFLAERHPTRVLADRVVAVAAQEEPAVAADEDTAQCRRALEVAPFAAVRGDRPQGRHRAVGEQHPDVELTPTCSARSQSRHEPRLGSAGKIAHQLRHIRTGNRDRHPNQHLPLLENLDVGRRMLAPAGPAVDRQPAAVDERVEVASAEEIDGGGSLD